MGLGGTAIARASNHSAIRRLTVKSREISQLQDIGLELLDRSEVWVILETLKQRT